MNSSTPFMLAAVGVGPQRTATSWLHQALEHHPDLHLPGDVKETMFFDERFDRGIDWYAWHFRKRAVGQRCLEIAPTYFDHDRARERLAAHNRELRILVNVRNPIARAFSLYRHHLGKGRVRGAFREAIQQMPRIVTSSRYAEHCPRWEQTFGAERMLYLVQEDIESDPDQTLAHVCQFLGVPVVALPGSRERVGASDLPRYPALARLAARTATALRARRLHAIANFGKRIGLKYVFTGGDGSHVRLTPDLHAELADRFARDIEYLEARLGRDFSAWRRPASQ